MLYTFLVFLVLIRLYAPQYIQTIAVFETYLIIYEEFGFVCMQDTRDV